MIGPDDSLREPGWDAFRAARDRFFSRVRPEAMDDPPPSICPDAFPVEWTTGGEYADFLEAE